MAQLHITARMYIAAPGAARATRRCGAPLRHMALRPGWAQGHVTYVRFVMRNASRAHRRLRNRECLQKGLCTPPRAGALVKLAAYEF